jgi:hypothetical protein
MHTPLQIDQMCAICVYNLVVIKETNVVFII